MADIEKMFLQVKVKPSETPLDLYGVKVQKIQLNITS